MNVSQLAILSSTHTRTVQHDPDYEWYWFARGRHQFVRCLFNAHYGGVFR